MNSRLITKYTINSLLIFTTCFISMIIVFNILDYAIDIAELPYTIFSFWCSIGLVSYEWMQYSLKRPNYLETINLFKKKYNITTTYLTKDESIL